MRTQLCTLILQLPPSPYDTIQQRPYPPSGYAYVINVWTYVGIEKSCNNDTYINIPTYSYTLGHTRTHMHTDINKQPHTLKRHTYKNELSHTLKYTQTHTCARITHSLSLSHTHTHTHLYHVYKHTCIHACIYLHQTHLLRGVAEEFCGWCLSSILGQN